MTPTATATANHRTSPAGPVLSEQSLAAAIGGITNTIDAALSGGTRPRVIPDEVERRLRAEAGRSAPAGLVKMALLADCVRVVETAVAADGRITPREIEHVFPVLFPAAGFFSKLREDYRRFAHPDDDRAREFLEYYAGDAGVFGKRCDLTRWLGLEICRRVAVEAGDSAALDAYENLVVRLMDEVIALGGVSSEERRAREEIADLISLRKQIEEVGESLGEGGEDPRIAAFCDPRGPTVFSATAHGHQVWERDPFDVDSVHPEARRKFERLVEGAAGPQAGERGRMLLVLGDSGAGKTHLMRAFRNHLHGRRAGYAGYMQMSSLSDDYARYALVNLLDSLERPYDPPDVEQSGLMSLSDAVAEVPGALAAADLEQLREGDLEPGADADFVSRLADDVLVTDALSDFDPDLLRALLYLQRRDPRIKSRVLKYLRCEHLTDYDRRILGGMAPRTNQEDPQRTIEDLGRLMWAADESALVLLVDQLEDLFNLDDAPERFRRALDVLRTLVERLPSAIVVVACLEDYWSDRKATLTRSVIDRLERDPEPARLTSARSPDEIEAVVAARLEFLYDSLGVRYQPEEPCFPLLPRHLEALANLRTRDVLDWCGRHQDQCQLAGELVEPPAPGTEQAPEADAGTVGLAKAWNDARTRFEADPPDDDDRLLELLAAATRACDRELGGEGAVRAERDGDVLAIRDGDGGDIVAGLCNKAPQGGGLLRQLEGVAGRAGDRVAAFVRCSEYPESGKSKTVRRLGELVRDGARRVVVEDSDWRAIMAFEAFVRERAGDPGLDAWLRSETPISQLKSLRELLRLDPDQRPRRPEPSERSEPPRARRESRPARATARAAAPGSPERGDDGVVLGRTAGVSPKPVPLPLRQLTTHTAVLGAPGSGKTTLALNLVEQLIGRGIPVIAVDRKGDLAGYARRGAWTGDGAGEAQRRFADRAEVAMYTPGAADGRPLSIPVLPPGMAELSSRDRNVIARHAASALGAMMGYKETETHRRRRSVLAKAIELLGQTGPEGVGLEQLIAFIDEPDPVLVNAIGKLDGKVFTQLVDNLEMLRLERGELLTEGDPLDCERLLRASAPGKAALSIISTKFLGDPSAIQFWVARLAVELSRWASRSPSKELQAALFLDEADLYIPASSKPVTKEPLLDLLKRARSAGLGLVLATQNPGDFDYKSRDNVATWFLGRVTTTRARQKMQPLFAEARANVSEKLATQGTGEFFLLHEGDVTSFRADRSLLDTEQIGEPELLELARGGG